MAIRVQALFTHDAHSRLLLVNEPGGGAPAPRLFLGRTRAGNLWRFRADLPETLLEELEARCVDEPVGQAFHRPPRHVAAYVRLLETHAPVHTLGMGPAYHFTAHPEPSRPLLALTATDAEKLRGDFEALMRPSASAGSYARWSTPSSTLGSSASSCLLPWVAPGRARWNFAR